MADPHMELVEPLDPSDHHSPLAAARLRRQWTREEAADRAGLSVEQAEWLEDGRLYRFPTGDDAVLAALLYATALGVDRREARRMAGLRVRPRPLDWNPAGRITVAMCVLVLVAAIAVVVAVPRISFGHGTRSSLNARSAAVGKGLLPPWKISVAVLNGSGDINYTRDVANRIGALGYRIQRVARASRFTYQRSVVYFPSGGRKIGARLARQLGADLQPLLGSRNSRRLVVAVGTAHL
jgi:Helix-turn-helix domain/LytR cell envelope-related transcriptional attenuator